MGDGPSLTPLPAPVERLLGGGRHIRLLVAGAVPPGLPLPPRDGFERVAIIGPAGPVVADPTRLPFVEALFDRALVATPLPRLSARAELREVWRVLAPAGLAVFVVKARRRWQLQAPGWTRDALQTAVEDAMFEILDWQVETLPERWHLVLVGKRDGLRPAMVGRVADAAAPVTA